MNTVQEQFDIDYKALRALVVKGKVSLANAKNWLARHDPVLHQLEVQSAFKTLVWKNRIDRQIEEMQKDEKLEKARDVKRGYPEDEE